MIWAFIILALLGFLVWLFVAIKNIGRDEVISEAQAESLKRIQLVQEADHEVEEHFNKVRDSIPDDWDAIDKLREKGPIDIRTNK